MTSAVEMVTKLRADEKEIKEKLERMRKPITELEAALNHIQGSISFYESKAKEKGFSEQIGKILKEHLSEGFSSIQITPKLRGMSHSEAVVAIAKHNGGIVRTQDAKRLMIKAGI